MKDATKVTSKVARRGLCCMYVMYVAEGGQWKGLKTILKPSRSWSALYCYHVWVMVNHAHDEIVTLSGWHCWAPRPLAVPLCLGTEVELQLSKENPHATGQRFLTGAGLQVGLCCADVQPDTHRSNLGRQMSAGNVKKWLWVKRKWYKTPFMWVTIFMPCSGFTF